MLVVLKRANMLCQPTTPGQQPGGKRAIVHPPKIVQQVVIILPSAKISAGCSPEQLCVRFRPNGVLQMNFK